MRLAAFAIAHFERSKAQPQCVARARQGDVEQAQVFAQALLFVACLGAIAHLQHQLAPSTRRGQVGRFDKTRIEATEAASKRHAHHRILQPLAFVDGDDFQQVGIAFQAHHLLVALLGVFSDLVHQPAHQGLLTFQLGAGALQQFSQVQKVGQAALATVAVQPACRQGKAVQGLAQHGQHTLAHPHLAQRAQGVHLGVEQRIVTHQLGQLGQAQAQAGQSQRSAHQGRVLRCGHGTQPVHQVTRFIALKDRVFVRQIHRSQLAPLQRTAHGGGLGASAHQNGNVLRAQAL